MAKSRKPTAPADKELRTYYDKTSLLAEGGDVRPVKMSCPKPRRLIALRLDEAILEGIKRHAARKGLNYSTLMRMWLTERLRRERP